MDVGGVNKAPFAVKLLSYISMSLSPSGSELRNLNVLSENDCLP